MHALIKRLLLRANSLDGTLSTSAAMAVIGILFPCILILNVAATTTETTAVVNDDLTTTRMTTITTENARSAMEDHHTLGRTENKRRTIHKDQVEKHKFADLMPDDYSIHEPPPLINGKPVPVKFSVSIKNIPELNEMKQMLSVEMNLRIYWQDTRLAHAANLSFESSNNENVNRSYISLHPIVLTQIWVPDIYTDYAKSVTTQRILSPPTSLRIYPNATIRYSSRILMDMSCPMEFKMYPADYQRCELRLESYGFTREELYFSWLPEGKTVNVDHRLAHFDFDAVLIDDKEDVNFPSGSYPAVSICLKFNRRLNFHLLQTYIPSGLFVIVSWLSFLVPRECAPGRLAICMTTLLTLTAMFGAVRQNTPSVSYIKALDVWMVGCIIFVFFALAEFASVLRLDKHLTVRERKLKKNPSDDSNSNTSCSNKSSWSCVMQKPAVGKFRFLSEAPDEIGTNLKHKKWSPNSKEDDDAYEVRMEDGDRNQKHRKKYRVTEDSITSFRRRMESVSATIAPAGFIIFNLCYWPWLLLTRYDSTC